MNSGEQKSKSKPSNTVERIRWYIFVDNAVDIWHGNKNRCTQCFDWNLKDVERNNLKVGSLMKTIRKPEKNAKNFTKEMISL